MTLKNGISTSILKLVFDAIPSMIFVVDEDVRIHEYNAEARDLLQAQKAAILHRRGGELLHCLLATDVPEGCGQAPHCKDCVRSVAYS